MSNDTKIKILDMGLKMWKEKPSSVNAYAISKRLGVVHGTVLYHFPDSVKDAVAAHALEVGDVQIISQLIAQKHIAVSHLTSEQKLSYLSQVV